MRIVLLELNLMRGNNIATGVKDQEARACSALINGTNKGSVCFSVEERHYAVQCSPVADHRKKVVEKGWFRWGKCRKMQQ